MTIVVLGVLASIVISSVRGLSTTARASSCGSDRAILTNAEEVYRSQHGRYATEAELVAAGTIRSLSTLSDVNLSGETYEVVAVADCVGAQGATESPGGGPPTTTVPTAMAATTTVPTAAALTIATVPSSVTAGAVITPPIEVTVLDANGNTFSANGVSVTIALTANPGGAALSGTETVTAVNGIATFGDLSLDKSGAGYLFSASASGTTAATSTGFTVVSAPAFAMVITREPTSGTTTSAWSEQPVIELQDAFGNKAATSSAPITLAISAGTGTPGAILSCSANPLNAVAGVAGFGGCKIGTAGVGYRLTVSSPGLGSRTTAPFTLTGPATKLVLTAQPTSELAGDLISPAVAVAVQDASGKVVTSSAATVSIAISANPGAGTLSGTTSVAVVNGIATFPNLSINKPGTGYKLTASSTGLTSIASTTFNITVGAPAQLTFTTQPSRGQSGRGLDDAAEGGHPGHRWATPSQRAPPP